MPQDSKAGPTRLSAPEFLSALERSGVFPTRNGGRCGTDSLPGRSACDSLALAHQLVDEGTLTEFQARRLLRGKKRLAFGRYALLDNIGQGSPRAHLQGAASPDGSRGRSQSDHARCDR